MLGRRGGDTHDAAARGGELSGDDPGGGSAPREPAGSSRSGTRPIAREGARGEEAPSPGARRPVRVLLVDDDEDMRVLLAELLAAEGYLVDTVQDGREALASLRAGEIEPSLILLDLMMPVISGWRFLTQRLTDPALRAVPVIVISAVSRAHETLADLDVAESLPKPLRLEHLLEAIERHARRDPADASLRVCG